jgi:hypothetical protein
MAEPENQALRLLRELRNDIKALDALDKKIDRNNQEIKEPRAVAQSELLSLPPWQGGRPPRPQRRRCLGWLIN